MNWIKTKENMFYRWYESREGNTIWYERTDKFLGRLKDRFQNLMFLLEKTPIKHLFPYGRYDFSRMYFAIRNIGTK